MREREGERGMRKGMKGGMRRGIGEGGVKDRNEMEKGGEKRIEVGMS